MEKNRLFVFSSIFFAFGIGTASVFVVENYLVYVSLAALAVFFVLAFLVDSHKFCIIVFFLVCAACGILRVNSSQKPNSYQELLGKKVELEGYIAQDIDIRLGKQMFIFRPKGFKQNVLVTTSLGQRFFYGDWVVVRGKITQAESFDDFNYPKYLERFNVYALSRYPSVLVLKNNRLNFLKYKILKIKYWFVARVGHFLGEPKSSLLLGILIGARKTLPQEIVEDFNNTGTSHIIAVSGFNITIIISALAFLTAYLGRKVSFWLVLLFILAFVIIAGASASVVRAAVMGGLLLASSRLGRQYSIVPSLFFAAFVMLLVNPKILAADIGFQLSFAATLGIVFFMPLFEKLAGGKLLSGAIGVFFTTMAAIISTLPLILLYFGRLSLVAPLANILILPVLLPASMLSGFLIAVPFVAPGFAALAGILLECMLWLERIMGRWKYSSLNMPVPFWLFFTMTIFVFVLWFWLKAMTDESVSKVGKDETNNSLRS